MGGKSGEVIIEVPMEKFYEVLVDYEKYPEFLGTIKSTEILSREENIVRVFYEVELIKTIQYTLKMEEDKPQGLYWSLEEGDFFKMNSGSWELEPWDDGNATKALYTSEVDFSLFVPKMITNKLVAVSLPQNLKDFKARAEELYS